jgi:dTMP kinase
MAEAPVRDQGRFIVLEGGEGVGKTTQVDLLGAWLKERGISHRVTREPGGTPVGEAIRSVVLGRTDLRMPPESELFLILAARAAFVREIVRPALVTGTVVIADRFSLSTLAYQGYARGLDLARVRRAIDIATDGLEPDLYVVLDVPVEHGIRRKQRGGMTPDRIEQEGTDFLQRVRNGYLALAEEQPRARLVDGLGTPEEVHLRVRRLLEETFLETFLPRRG